MMSQTIAIPSPSRADTETVITALETAAVFRSKGDGREAMRWLRRAAESAGEAGDDERALSLSRIVADLHEELEALPRPEPTPYPPPPSTRSARPPSARPPSVRPPSVRPPSVLPRPSQAPRPSARPSYLGAARAPSSVVPSGLAVASALPPQPESVSAPPAPSSGPEPESASPASSPEPASVSAPPLELARMSSPSSPPTTGARHAARVQVAISTTKVGVLEVRLLAEGESARLGSSEAFLVMLDPASTLLSR